MIEDITITESMDVLKMHMEHKEPKYDSLPGQLKPGVTLPPDTTMQIVLVPLQEANHYACLKWFTSLREKKTKK